MTAGAPVQPGLQQERLRGDRRHARVEIGQQQPGKLQAALADHVRAHGRGPVMAG